MPNRRKDDDPEKPKLTPGERFLNWCKALAIIVPLFGAGWASNTETVKSLYTPAPETERGEVVTVDSPKLSCPPCNLKCPEIPDFSAMIKTQCSLKEHEKEYHQ